MMRLAYALLAACLACGVAVAQPLEQKSRTKITVQDGKNVTVTGCVHRTPEGGLMLTHAAGKDGAVGSYILAALEGEDDELEDLGEHVGHRVEIKGKAADQGEGRIRIATKNEVRTPDGEKAKTESRSEMKGDLKGLPYLGVDSVRMLATVCP